MKKCLLDASLRLTQHSDETRRGVRLMYALRLRDRLIRTTQVDIRDVRSFVLRLTRADICTNITKSEFFAQEVALDYYSAFGAEECIMSMREETNARVIVYCVR
jgi:hypothetical protein